LTADEWRSAKDLFSSAVALADAEREPFLQSQSCSSEVVAEVRSLLAAYEESPDFLDQANAELPDQFPADSNHQGAQQKVLQRLDALLEYRDQPSDSSAWSWDNTGPDESADSNRIDHGLLPGHIGPYRILRTLGEGGMGIAYLAERDDGAYRQTVAIKVLKDTARYPGLVRRFHNERQVLAGLDHPYIARLIDGGTTASGQPFYSMEYVEGESVIEYARSHSIGLRERLELFGKICDAVSAAHRHLVVHGDIKPANILVSSEGLPKLLDFGLARIIQPAALDVTLSMVLLTPGYASPEQIRGERLSTATDIYSLGVLLFELLAEESPYGKATTSPLELCRAICEEAPCKPSAAAKTVTPGFGPRQLRGDLDHIVLKALRKSPDERYATVEKFHSDIQRYLDGFPVEAARGSGLYHFRKFVVRRRWLVASAGILLMFASGAIWQIWRAERIAELRFNQVRQLAHSVVFDMHDAIQELPGSTMARKMLIERALQYLKALEATSGRNRDLELELARAYTKIGSVQAASASASLDDCAAGIQNLEHARQLLRNILRRSDSDEEATVALVDADLEAANVRSRRGEMPEWRTLRAEATQLLNALSARHKDDYKLRLRALTIAAATLDGEHNPPAALHAYQEVLAAAAQAPVDADTRLLQGRTERQMADELQAIGDRHVALAHHKAALGIFQDLLADSPTNTRYRLESSWSHAETGWLEHEFHDERTALADFRTGLELLRAIATADPRNQLARLEIGKLEMTASETVELAVSPQRAAQDLRDAISIFSESMKLDPTNDDARIHMAQSEFMYAKLQVRMAHGECSAGVEAYRYSLQMASAVKHDYSATSVFNMHQLREELRRKLAACASGSAK
jgi:tetratricopeptide (TPR) repeat protein